MLGLVNALDVRPHLGWATSDRSQMQLAIWYPSVSLNPEARTSRCPSTGILGTQSDWTIFTCSSWKSHYVSKAEWTSSKGWDQQHGKLREPCERMGSLQSPLAALFRPTVQRFQVLWHTEKSGMGRALNFTLGPTRCLIGHGQVVTLQGWWAVHQRHGQRVSCVVRAGRKPE